MVDRIISWCITNRFSVVAFGVSLTLLGLWTARHTAIDAIPDLSDVQIIVSTEWPGRSPDIIEAQVTFPVVSALVSTPGVRTVRGVTDFGISFVYVLFDDTVDRYWARSRVLEQLQTVRAALPDGVTPNLGPDATGVGWIFEYALTDESGEHGLQDLRSLQDWTIRYGIASVDGVAEVATIGGFVKQYQIALDPVRLSSLNLSPKEVVDAVRASNSDVEGRVLEFAGREYMVRARGLLRSIEDIENVAVSVSRTGTPIRVRDVAQVRLGPDIRRGLAELDGRGEVVGGIVIMRFGQDALAVIDRVKLRLSEIQSALPSGVSITTVYDRSRLIHESIGTLRRIVIEEILVVSLVIWLFLGRWRAALIPIAMLPAAVLASFIPLWYFGITANIMSLGGIALAIGVLVDAAIVMVENGYRRTVEADDSSRDSLTGDLADAARQVGRPVFFSLGVILVSFAPVFLLESQEGRLFRPLAMTKTFGVTAATMFAITLVPALMVIMLGRGHVRAARPNRLTAFLNRHYEPILRLALRRRWTFLIANVAIIPIALLLLPRLGHEFMPHLYEGSILYMPTAAPGLSITEVTRLLQLQDRVLRGFPEVERVFGTAGRATTATDNSPLSMITTIVTLKPRSAWRRGVTVESLQQEMDTALQVPGVPNVWTQPIRSRVDMLATGIRTPIGIKVLGPELDVIQQIGRHIEAVLSTVPGTRSVYAERMAEGYFVDISIKREEIARHGLTVEDVQSVVQSAVGGANVGVILDGRERYPINVRYQHDFRSDPVALERVLVKTAAGGQVALGRLAEVTLSTGPAMIRTENGVPSGYVYVDTSTRDLRGYVVRAQRAFAERLQLPAGYRLEWSGQYEAHVRSADRLRLIIPLAVVAIFVLLYFTFHSFSEASIIMLSVLYAMTGGVLLQWFLGYNFSVAVWVGYIALFGVSVQTGVIMVTYLHEALDRRRSALDSITEEDLLEATVEGAVQRLRPKLMTVLATTLGLLPILWSTGIGADVLKPIAGPIVGGMVTSTIHVLLITPVIFYVIRRRALRRD